MYLKRVNEQTAKHLTNSFPFVSGTWYKKTNENGTVAKNKQGQTLYTCMNEEELQSSLYSKEFSRVEF
jgi:predicted lipoprotein with Yx(FWY)xxD motif